MSRQSRTASRRFTPQVDGLEARELLTTAGSTSSYQNSIAKHAYDQFTSLLQRIEFSSLATPAQYLALRDDTRAISQAVSAPGARVSGQVAQNEVITATVLIDRSLLQGWLSDQGWNEIRQRLGVDLSGLNVPPAVLDKTVVDLKSAAVSAGVDPGTADILDVQIASVQSARNQLHGGTSGISYRDPEVYYTQHLRGFFRGWAVQKTNDQAKLHADVARISAGSPGASAVLNRDISRLTQLTSAITSDANDDFTTAYITAFAQGSPSPTALATFHASAISALGTTANPPRVAILNKLTADAPAFFTAAASSSANVQTIAIDTQAVVDDGQGSSLNPFLIVIRPGSVAAH
jgi:hypothetical protein